jgi:hypothetical protein
MTTEAEDIWCPVCNWQAPRASQVCELHGEEGNPPQVRGSEGFVWENKDGPSRAVSATRPGPDRLPLDKNERG